LKKITVIFVSILMMAFSFQTPSTGFDYLPMNEGFWIEYQKFDITGIWYADTMKLDVVEPRRLPSTECGRAPGKQCDKIRISFSRYCVDNDLGYVYDRCGWFQFWHYTDQPMTPINYQRGLVYGQDFISGKSCISEIRNEMGGFMTPPECIIASPFIAGQRIQGLTDVHTSPSMTYQATGSWEYGSIASYANWGEFPDVVRTALNEHTGFKYNYAFMNGVGPVDIWFIGNNCTVVAGQNQCQGTEYYATNWLGR